MLTPEAALLLAMLLLQKGEVQISTVQVETGLALQHLRAWERRGRSYIHAGLAGMRGACNFQGRE